MRRLRAAHIKASASNWAIGWHRLTNSIRPEQIREDSEVMPKAIRFDRNELAGAFGDLGLAIPLILAMILTNGLDPASVLIMFGLMHIVTGFAFGLPMPVQPLKAMAAIMLTTKLPKEYLFGAGLVVGVFFTLLALTRLANKLDKVPRTVTRGIQFGLGINLTLIALGYMQNGGLLGWILSTVGVVVILILYNARKVPPSLIVIALGVAASVIIGLPQNILNGVGLDAPKFFLPSMNGLLQGTLLLAIPQIPLSIGNSIIATALLTTDLFPSRQVSARKLSLTYGLMNLVSPFFSGVPVCHGAGGLAGHYRFGGRTGGTVIIIGAIFLIIGLFFSRVVSEVLSVFPLSLLGVLLFFTALELALLIRETANKKEDFFVALAVGAAVIGLPYGYLIGLVGGIILSHLLTKGKLKL